jgi:uncharacterized protein YndB with AHSA1/START domain
MGALKWNCPLTYPQGTGITDDREALPDIKSAMCPEAAHKQHEAMAFKEGWGIVAGQLADLAEAEARQTAASAAQ